MADQKQLLEDKLFFLNIRSEWRLNNIAYLRNVIRNSYKEISELEKELQELTKDIKHLNQEIYGDQ